MAHPMMGMLVSNYNGMGMRIQGLGHQPQMGGIFDDLINNLQTQAAKSGQGALNNLIASTFKTVASDPTVQQAVVASGNDAAIANLAAQLKAAQLSTYNTVKNNPMTTALIVGGVGVGAILLFMALRK